MSTIPVPRGVVGQAPLGVATALTLGNPWGEGEGEG